jgi:hypothetical protein
MVKGAWYWADQAEQPGFSRANGFISDVLVRCVKFLVVLHMSSATDK